LELPDAINVPPGALLNSGLHRTVFVTWGNRTFERRRVETGWLPGENVEIGQECMANETFVVSVHHMID
jgi:hypothetical protein